MFDILILILTSSYVAIILFLIRTFSDIPKVVSTAKPLVSVIVAARNEEASLPELLSALQIQSYPNLEILIVDDRSTDLTASKVSAAAANDPRIRLINIVDLSSDLSPKKNAITQAIRQSRGEIICLTDADCLPSPEWVEGLVEYFEPRVGMVAGFSPYRMLKTAPLLSSQFQRILVSFVQYEEIITSFLAASCSHAGFPWLCSGRNLAYRREVFEEVGGFSSNGHSVSGDDDLLLQTIRRKTEWKIVYALNPQTFVSTSPPTTANDFLQQRLRHFSDGKHYLLTVQAFLLWFHASNLAILLYFALGFLGAANLLFGSLALGAKLLVDCYALVTSSKRFEQRLSLINFVPNEILYVLYNTLIGPMGFFERFTWKQ